MNGVALIPSPRRGDTGANGPDAAVRWCGVCDPGLRGFVLGDVMGTINCPYCHPEGQPR